MARFEAQFRSKTREVAGMSLLREFGGMKPSAPSYRFEFVKFSAHDEKRALAKGREIAKTKNLVMLEVTKVVWKKHDALLR